MSKVTLEKVLSGMTAPELRSKLREINNQVSRAKRTARNPKETPAKIAAKQRLPCLESMKQKVEAELRKR